MIQIDDKELEQELKGMHLCNWEARNYGKGRRKLYIRLEPDVKTYKVNVRRTAAK